ncbi:MAG: hypothetical protein ACE365_06690 [Gammaproteobacteria bacterium]
MYKKLSVLLVVFAVVVAILAIVLPEKNLNIVIAIENFFEIMIPILAVGALLKFMFCTGKSDSHS